MILLERVSVVAASHVPERERMICHLHSVNKWKVASRAIPGKTAVSGYGVISHTTPQP